MADTSIQWTNKVWNPVAGCSIVSPGCHQCYAMKFAHRFSGKGQRYEGLTRLRPNGKGPVWTGKVRLVREPMTAPFAWRKPCRVFVNSMSDLFHEALGFEDIAAVFGVMASCPQHTFQILTKRAARMEEFFRWLASFQLGGGPWPTWVIYTEAQNRGIEQAYEREQADWPLPNVWLGVSVEDQRHADERIPSLIECPAAVRFLSCEPLLGPLDLRAYLGSRHCHCAFYGAPRGRFYGHSDNCINDHCALAGGIDDCNGQMVNCDCGDVHWLIVGGESGGGARACEAEWIASLIEQAEHADKPIFVKQLGAKPLGVDGLRDAKGGDMREWPKELRVREFPEVRR